MNASLPALSAFVLVLAGGCAHMKLPAPATAHSYELIATYPVGGAGGWDFVSVDEKSHRLFVSCGDRVQVVDTVSGKAVGEVQGTAGVHGIAVDAKLGLGFTSRGAATR